MRATPEAASADAAVQTARLAKKGPSKGKRQVTKTSCIIVSLFLCNLFSVLLIYLFCVVVRLSCF